jgi:segregation and condensation protein B
MTTTQPQLVTEENINQPALTLDAYPGEEGLARLAAMIEALALVAEEAVELPAIADIATTTTSRVEEALLWHRQQPHRGIVLQQQGPRITVASNPFFASQVRKLLKLDREARLTPAALETLAIIAYQQPVTRSEIESVRGVDSSGVLATLHNRGLVDAIGRLPSVGNPIQYGTTVEFLRLFGLHSLDDLPALGQIEGRDISTALTAAVASASESDETAEPEP